jgi:hypothetical protein
MMLASKIIHPKKVKLFLFYRPNKKYYKPSDFHYTPKNNSKYMLILVNIEPNESSFDSLMKPMIILTKICKNNHEQF